MEEQINIQQFLKKENLFELPKTFEAIITDIKQSTAKEIFGASAKDPTQNILVVEFENDQYKIKGRDFFNIPADIEKINVLSRLGKAIKLYDGLQIGKIISIKNDDFLKIII